MKVIIAPDKFKGSLSSFDACAAMEAGVRKKIPNAEILCFPMADGGDGFSQVLKFYLKTESIYCHTLNALGEPIHTTYEWQAKTQTAIIETASASGLAQIPFSKRNPLAANTMGTGLQIKDAIHRGAKSILLGLGGSATTDMGTGILQALGFSFFDQDGLALYPCGGSLSHFYKVHAPHELPKVKFILCCDVRNPLYGTNGAAHVYGPQKGASVDEVAILDSGLQHAHSIFNQSTGKELSALPGAGAAGGIAEGLGHFFDIEIKPGFDLVMEASNMKRILPGVDLLLTGEGRLDAQSFEGKVVGGLIFLAKAFNINCGIVCGQTEINPATAAANNCIFIKQMVHSGIDVQDSMQHAGKYLEQLTAMAMKAL